MALGEVNAVSCEVAMVGYSDCLLISWFPSICMKLSSSILSERSLISRKGD